MQYIDLFEEFSNQPPVVKNQTTEPADRPINGKRNVMTARIEYEQCGRKELRVTDRKTGRYQRTELRGILYETLLENLYWRFKVIGKSNAHEYIIYAFMRQILSDEELLNEKQRIDDIVHSQCKDAAKCQHRNQPTWHEHLNDCIRRSTQ
ncbi:MAG: hypothetical protein IBX56_03395 [Methylomicrobium sp.]|nr:hypothetical protein [Methylomicrobium sp.]